MGTPLWEHQAASYKATQCHGSTCMGTPAWAMPEAEERHTIMGAPAWVMPEAGERHTEQHPIKQHNAMGALPWAHLHGMSCNILQ